MNAESIRESLLSAKIGLKPGVSLCHLHLVCATLFMSRNRFGFSKSTSVPTASWLLNQSKRTKARCFTSCSNSSKSWPKSQSRLVLLQYDLVVDLCDFSCKWWVWFQGIPTVTRAVISAGKEAGKYQLLVEGNNFLNVLATRGSNEFKINLQVRLQN